MVMLAAGGFCWFVCCRLDAFLLHMRQERELVLRGIVWYDTLQEAVAVWHSKHGPTVCAHRWFPIGKICW